MWKLGSTAKSSVTTVVGLRQRPTGSVEQVAVAGNRRCSVQRASSSRYGWRMLERMCQLCGLLRDSVAAVVPSIADGGEHL